MNNIEFGIDTFGDVTYDLGGKLISHGQAVRNVVELGITAEESGLDVIAIGEHHRYDYAVSAPELVLAGIATATKRIKLSTAVTVLSSDDPVRIHERFATLDALSEGRAEIILGRGSFTESFPLFGYDLSDYEELFNEKLELFTQLRTNQPLTWSGKHTQDLHNVTLYPTRENPEPLPNWIAVGGSPQSVLRAAHYDLPLMLAIIGGTTARFAPFANLYREAREKYGHSGESSVGYHFVGHVANTDEEAFQQFSGPYLEMHRRMAAERGWAGLTETALRHELPGSAIAVGSVETVAQKVAQGIRDLGAIRVDMKVINGPTPDEYSVRSVELFGREVVPRVREILHEN